MYSHHPDTCAVILDSLNHRQIEIHSTMLINQIARDANKIAKSFDDLHGKNLKVISTQFAHCFALLTSGTLKATQENDDLRIACSELLSNCLNSIAAATYLVRGGFVLQPGTVVRSSLETMAVVLHILQFQNELELHKKNKLESTRTISSAKNIFPPFGQFYGLLSKNFTHIGKLHKQITPICEYTESYEPLALNLQFITSSVWMCYVTSELAFLDVVTEPRYWAKQPVVSKSQTTYCYNPSVDEKTWMSEFLNLTGHPSS